ncbi:thioredoxin family protein [Confluentibacter sediminis]|uniref:thioredoxin family protein n=1 Tax=Confluentibacter sediminis TaxID=2219045 RepID=UPI000DACA259|nr:thioredoxin family protein [Confluentibacter sediminis]
MKSRILLVLFIMFSIVTSAQTNMDGIAFSHGNWAEIKAKAKKENKLIFIDCYTSWCGPCKKLDREIFPLKSVGKVFNENFVSYKLDMEKGEGIDLAKKYHVGAYPTLLWVDHNGNLVHRVVGYMKENELIEQVNKATEGGNYNKNLEKRYHKNKNNPEIVKQYLDYLLLTADSRSIEVAEQYLSIIPESDYTTPYVFKLLSNSVTNPFCDAFTYVVNNREIFNDTYQKEYVDVMFTNVYDKYAGSLSNNVRSGKEFDEAAYKKLLDLMEKSDYEHKNELAEDILVKVLLYQKNWKNYAAKINSIIKNNSYKKITYRNYVDWYKPVVESNCEDPEVLESVLNWIDNAIDVNKVFSMSFIKKNWEAKIVILEKMKRKEAELLKAKTELELLNKLETKQEEAQKEKEKTEEILRKLMRG